MDAADTITAPPKAPPGELELKLFVPPSSVALLWAHPLIAEHAIGALRAERLDNRYYDTPERDLKQHRMALRLRRIGRRWLQTLKVAEPDEGSLSRRGEWETPVAGAALDLAALRGTPISELGSAQALTSRLKPLFTTRFRRESRLLRLNDGSVVECAFDIGVVGAGRGTTRRSLPICELELEAKGDITPDLLRFAARLARDVALIPLAASKAARGYRLADREALEPARVRLPTPRPDDDARAHLARVLEACNRTLLVNAHALFERAVDASPGAVEHDIESIHQARVAVRRMRSALRLFRPVANGGRLVRLDDALRAVGQAFGEARDWDVFVVETLVRLDAAAGVDDVERPALDALRVQAEARRIDAHRALMRHLDGGPFGATTIAVERIVERLANETDSKRGANGDVPLAGCAPKWLSRQRSRVVRLSRRIAVLDAEQRHGLRIEVKRLRYAVDLFDGLFDPEAVERYRDALSDVQEKLGKLNDAVVADALMQSLPEAASIRSIRARFGGWIDRQTVKQLPKVAALSVALELTRQPWLATGPAHVERVEGGA